MHYYNLQFQVVYRVRPVVILPPEESGSKKAANLALSDLCMYLPLK